MSEILIQTINIHLWKNAVIQGFHNQFKYFLLRFLSIAVLCYIKNKKYFI